MKLRASGEFTYEGRQVTRSGIYVYWFVADGQLTASHGGRMWSMARELLKTGVLQRWAYVACFMQCAPGDEEQTYRRMEKFLQASVPQFQLVPGPQAPGSAVARTVSNQFR